MAVKREAEKPRSPDATPKAARGAKVKLAVQQAADRAERLAKAKAQPKPDTSRPKLTAGKAKAKAKALPAPKGAKKPARTKGAATPKASPASAALPVPCGPGRPSLYKPEYCDRIVQLAYDEGMGAAELAFELRISRQTWHDWQEAHPEFLDAVKYAKWAAQAWWERKGRRGINEGKTFNALAWKFQMLNRFRDDYRDRQEKQHDVSDELAELLTELDGATGRFRAAA
jgi:hypothetical protein